MHYYNTQYIEFQGLIVMQLIQIILTFGFRLVRNQRDHIVATYDNSTWNSMLLGWIGQI